MRLSLKQIVFILSLLPFALLYSQDEFLIKNYPQTAKREFIDHGKPINELPKYVHVYTNRIYLYTDFKKVNKSRIPLYLINNSPDTLLIKG